LFQFASFSYVGSHLARRLRGMAFQAMLHKDMAFHDKEENSTGVLSTQLATDATLVNVRGCRLDGTCCCFLLFLLFLVLFLARAVWRLLTERLPLLLHRPWHQRAWQCWLKTS